LRGGKRGNVQEQDRGTAHRRRGVWVQGSDESRTNELRQPDLRPLIERWKTLQRLHSPLLPLIAGDHWGDLQNCSAIIFAPVVGSKIAARIEPFSPRPSETNGSFGDGTKGKGANFVSSGSAAVIRRHRQPKCLASGTAGSCGRDWFLQQRSSKRSQTS